MTKSDIEKVYRKQLKLVHPDKSLDPQAGIKFQRLHEAYELLLRESWEEAQHWLKPDGHVEQAPADPRTMPGVSVLQANLSQVFAERARAMRVNQTLTKVGLQRGQQRASDRVVAEKGQG